MPSVAFGDVDSTNWPGLVSSLLQSLGKALEVVRERLAVVLPRFSVRSWRCTPLQTEESQLQGRAVVDVVEECGEPRLLILLAIARTRSSALCTDSRHCVRPVFCWLEFPLVGFLPSVPSAASTTTLFGNFSGTMNPSDFPYSFIIGVASLDFPMRPGLLRSGRTRDIPVPV